MRGSDDRQNAAGGGERRLDCDLGIRVVELPAPDAIGIQVLLPIPARAQRGVGVGAAAARPRWHQARSAPPLEGEWLHDLDAARSAELEGSRVAGGENWVSPQQQALSAWPDAPEDVEAAVFAHQVGVAVAGKAAGAGAQRHEAAVAVAGLRHFLVADVGLVVRHSQVLGPELRRHFDGHARGQREVDHALVDALGVHVDLDLAAGALHAVEDGAPERVAAYGDAAFAVDAEGDAADGGAGAEESGKRVAAVRAVVLGVESLDGVVRMRAVLPLVAMHPDAQLELEAVGGGLLADEAQRFEIAVALLVRQVRGADIVARHGEKEGVGEEKVGVGDSAQEVVAYAEAEVEAVEAVFREHGEVTRPHLAVVKPGRVFDLAGEEALDAADGVGGPLHVRLRQCGGAGQDAGGKEKVAAVHNQDCTAAAPGRARRQPPPKAALLIARRPRRPNGHLPAVQYWTCRSLN